MTEHEVEKRNYKEYLLSITDKVSFDRPMKISHRYIMATEIDIFSETDQDLQDGSYKKIYKARQVGEATLQNEEKKKIYAKAKGSQSQMTRYAIEQSNNTDMDDEKFYNMIQGGIRRHLDKIIPMIDKWDDDK